MIRSTLFRRFFLRFLVGLGIAFGVFFALSHLFQIRVVDAERRAELQQEATWMARHTHISGANMLAGAWRTMHSSVRITFIGADGELVGDSHPERAAIDFDAVRRGEEPRGHLAVTEEVPGGGRVVMSAPYAPSFPSGLKWELGVAILLIIGPMVLLLYPFVRSMSSTLKAMGRMAQEVSAGHFGKTVAVSRADELGALVRSFNDMSCKLAEAERLNSRLLHDVSHELRSPLTRIQVLAETIENRPEEKADCIRGIEQEVGLLDRLVGDLLQVARIEADSVQTRDEAFSLLPWASSLFGRLGRSVRSNEIEWQLRMPKDDIEVRGDAQRLSLAISNVVDNAAHALVDRKNAAIEIDVCVEDKHWIVEVRDNGPGISPEHLPHIFRRFYRVDEHRNQDTGGVGLGLSLVRAIAEAHKGSVSVQSEVGEGTRVTLSIPVA